MQGIDCRDGARASRLRSGLRTDVEGNGGLPGRACTVRGESRARQRRWRSGEHARASKTEGEEGKPGDWAC